MTMFFDKISELRKENIVMKNRTYSLDSFTDKFSKSNIDKIQNDAIKWKCRKEEYEVMLHRVFGQDNLNKFEKRILEK